LQGIQKKKLGRGVITKERGEHGNIGKESSTAVGNETEKIRENNLRRKPVPVAARSKA
jgi:hypothetical protein